MNILFRISKTQLQCSIKFALLATVGCPKYFEYWYRNKCRIMIHVKKDVIHIRHVDVLYCLSWLAVSAGPVFK